VIEKMPIIAMPLPDGGQVVCRVDAITAATTNMRNNEMTDVYIQVACPEGITIDVDIDSFTTSWLTALLTTIEDWRAPSEMH
jgi:hypothetical protein